MRPARWQQIAQIFEDALEREVEERTEFVYNVCAGDDALAAEVLQLLRADQHVGNFLETGLFRTVASLSPHLPPLLSMGNVVASRFEILRFIGEGGMGQVYEAIDLELKGRIALKAIRPEIAADPRMLSRFRREVQLTRMITHPNVCRTFDIEHHSSASGDRATGDSRDLTFLTMELLDGETLSARLRRDGRFTPGDALPLVLQMIDALDAAHAVGVVHCDFKPSNVLLVPSAPAKVSSGSASVSKSSIWSASGVGICGRVPRVVVTDFGLARAIAAGAEASGHVGGASVITSLTGDQALMGTPVYMAPEQFERGEVSIASDIYSLGLVMFEMVTGQRPFADKIPFAEATKRLKQPAPSAATVLRDLDPAWEAAISRCLALEVKDRFATFREVADALTNANDALATMGKPPAVVVVDTTASTKPTAHLSPSRIVPSLSAEAFVSPRRKYAAAAIVVLSLSLSAIIFRYYSVKTEEAKLAEGSTVLLTNIQNSTGDKWFDNATELVRRQLLQSPYFSLMDSDKIRKTLAQMLKPDDAVLDPQTAREVAMRNGVRRVVFGTVSRVGDSYGLDLDIERPDNNPLRFRQHWDNHWTWNTHSGSANKDMPSGFLEAIRDSSDWIRHQIGESANDIAREDAPPEDVTTANWEALSEFAQAEKFRAAGQNESAVNALENAVTADPDFGLAYARLGDILVSISRFAEGYGAYDKALVLGQQRLTRRERDRIRGIYANDVWDYHTAEAMFRDYTTYYPNDYLGWFYRGTPLMMMGQTDEAIESLKKAAEIDPSRLFAPAHIARFDLILGNFEDAAKWIQHLRDYGHSDSADLAEGESDFLRGLHQQSQICFTRLTNSKDPLYRSYGYSLLTRLLAEQGSYSDALSAVEEGLEVDVKSGDLNHRTDKILDRAYLECHSKRYDSCLRDITLALDLDHSLQRSLSAATLLGQVAHEAKGSAKIRIVVKLRSIEAKLPAGNFRPLSDIIRARVHGEALLAEGSWRQALDEFRKASRSEPPVSDKEYLGRALLAEAENASDSRSAKRSRQDAIAAFSIMSNNPGMVWHWAMLYPPGFCNFLKLSIERVRSDLGSQEKEPSAK